MREIISSSWKFVHATDSRDAAGCWVLTYGYIGSCESVRAQLLSFLTMYIRMYAYSQISLQSHLILLHSFYNNTHVGNCFTGLCTKCTGYSNSLVIAACCSGTSGVAVERFDCTAARCSGTSGVVVERFDCTAACCSGTSGVVVKRFDCTAACCSGTSGVAVERFDCTAACCSGTSGVAVERFECTAACCSGTSGVL